MIKFIFNLILIIGIFSVNSAYSKELVLLCTEKEKKIGELIQPIGETNTMIIDLNRKIVWFPPSDKTQKVQIIEPNEIRWYIHYQNEKNLTIIAWNLLNRTNGEWVAQSIYIPNNKYIKMKKALSIAKDELKRWMIVSTNGLLLKELTKLNSLYQEGAITEEEFSKAKSIVLNPDLDKSQIKKKKKKLTAAERKQLEDAEQFDPIGLGLIKMISQCKNKN